ncbi:MAG: hypothetical protein EAX89_14665 [Candidatus Lokiarchaeota archaeon]|nr:hypothetical protein [Candidatus Lokiarchaeota archaeon]
MDLFDWIFIISGFIFFSSIIAVFISWTKDKINLVKVIGYLLIALMAPMVIVLINYFTIGKELKFIIYVILIISYLVVELCLDKIFKIDFRSKPSKHVPYIILEYAACFSFVFGALTLDLVMGWIMSFFFWGLLVTLIYYIIDQKKKKQKT